MIPNLLILALNDYTVEYVNPDDLLPGDVVAVGVDEIEAMVVVLGTEPAFNPQFRPVRFSDDPRYARDMSRSHDIRTFRWRHHGRRDTLGRDLTQLAYLAGAAA